MTEPTKLFDPDVISLEVLLSGNPKSEDYLKGLINISWGKEKAQMNIAQARALAIRLLECATCAETDELLVAFLNQRIGLPLPNSVAALRDLRLMRQDWLGERKRT